MDKYWMYFKGLIPKDSLIKMNVEYERKRGDSDDSKILKESP